VQWWTWQGIWLHFGVWTVLIQAVSKEGPSNRFRFGQTPWGTLIKFLSLPFPLQYNEGVTTTRWIPK
jgi:hypothetical protein